MPTKHQPVLIAASALMQKDIELSQSLDVIELMTAALKNAAEQAGISAQLSALQQIMVPQGLWPYGDPAKLIANNVGANQAKTLFAKIGVSQQTLLTRACLDIQTGKADMIAVVGGEAKYRALRAAIAQQDLPDTHQAECDADTVLEPAAELWAEEESAAGLAMPVGFYALMEDALRNAVGESVDQNRDELARIYGQFSQVASGNSHAWDQQLKTVASIRNESADNRMLSFPYTKWHNSQWNVDQASALIFCSLEKAQALGVDESLWVYPLSAGESNHMSVVSARKELDRCYGAKLAGEAALALASKAIDDIDFLELYSCFPAAVRMYARELKIDMNRPLTVTGGMPFAGGPLNNFVLYSLVKMVELLRENPKSTGLISTVSGMLTKQGLSLWSATKGVGEFAWADVSADVAEQTRLCNLTADYEGMADIVAATVLHNKHGAQRAIVIADTRQGDRLVAYSADEQVMKNVQQQGVVGKKIAVQKDASFTLV